jgi:hypothetical protein
VAKSFDVITGGVPNSNPPAMPAGLGKHGETLWRQVQKEYEVNDVGGREMLFQICAAADMAARLRAKIDDEGVTIKSKGISRENPLIKQELACRSFVVRGLQRLGLNFEPIRSTPGRPGYA